MDDAVWPDERAGWWRRLLALALDGLCVAVPSAIIGAILFALTGGYLQWSGPGLQMQSCASVTSIPANLDPAPPLNSNEARVCESYSVAGQIARVLIVGRTTRADNTVTNVSRGYALSASGRTGGYDLSWITWVSLLALLVGSEWRTGTTPGKRLLGLRVIASWNPEGRPVPLRLITTRYAVALGVLLVPIGIAMSIGFVSVVLLQRLPPFVPVGFAIIFAIICGWTLWNTIRIVGRRPTIYDYIARTEVILASSRPAAAHLMPQGRTQRHPEPK